MLMFIFGYDENMYNKANKKSGEDKSGYYQCNIYPNHKNTPIIQKMKLNA